MATQVPGEVLWNGPGVPEPSVLLMSHWLPGISTQQEPCLQTEHKEGKTDEEDATVDA